MYINNSWLQNICKISNELVLTLLPQPSLLIFVNLNEQILSLFFLALSLLPCFANRGEALRAFHMVISLFQSWRQHSVDKSVIITM